MVAARFGGECLDREKRRSGDSDDMVGELFSVHSSSYSNLPASLALRLISMSRVERRVKYFGESQNKFEIENGAPKIKHALAFLLYFYFKYNNMEQLLCERETHEKQDKKLQKKIACLTSRSVCLTCLAPHIIVPYQKHEQPPYALIAWWGVVFSFLRPSMKDHIQLRFLCRMFSLALPCPPLWLNFPDKFNVKSKTLKGLFRSFAYEGVKTPEYIFLEPGKYNTSDGNPLEVSTSKSITIVGAARDQTIIYSGMGVSSIFTTRKKMISETIKITMISLTVREMDSTWWSRTAFQLALRGKCKFHYVLEDVKVDAANSVDPERLSPGLAIAQDNYVVDAPIFEVLEIDDVNSEVGGADIRAPVVVEPLHLAAAMVVKPTKCIVVLHLIVGHICIGIFMYCLGYAYHKYLCPHPWGTSSMSDTLSLWFSF